MPKSAQTAGSQFVSRLERAERKSFAKGAGWRESATVKSSQSRQRAVAAASYFLRSTAGGSAQSDASTTAGARLLATPARAVAAASHLEGRPAKDSARWRAVTRRRFTPACAAKSRSRRRYTRAGTTRVRRSIVHANALLRLVAGSCRLPSARLMSPPASLAGFCLGGMMYGR